MTFCQWLLSTNKLDELVLQNDIMCWAAGQAQIKWKSTLRIKPFVSIYDRLKLRLGVTSKSHFQKSLDVPTFHYENLKNVWPKSK